jgi:hypothetical protein
MKNSKILDTDKEMYRICYIYNKFVPLLLYFNIKIDGHVLYQCILIYGGEGEEERGRKKSKKKRNRIWWCGLH